MNNKIFNVNGRTKEQLLKAIDLAMTSEYTRKYLISGWYIDPALGIVLLKFVGDASEHHNKFPVPFNAQQITDVVFDWLQTEEAKKIPCVDFDANSNHDGHNTLGWRAYIGEWSYNGDNRCALIAVKPAYCWPAGMVNDMKGFHVICAKCGSMDVYFKAMSENIVSLSCENCSELTDVFQHNEYMKEVKENKKWYIS